MRIAALNTKNMSPATICITMKPVKFSISSNFPTRPITFPHPHQHLTQAQRMWHWTSWQHIMAFFAQMWPRMLESKQKTVKLEMPHQTFFFGRFVFGCPVCPLCLVCLFLLGPSWLVGYFSSLNLVCVFLLDPSLHIVPTTFLEAHMYLHIFSYPFTSQHAIAWSLISWHGHAWHGDGSKDNVHDVMFLPCGCFCELCVDGSQHGKKKEIFHETS